MRLSNSGCPSSLTLSLRIIQAMLRASVRIVCIPSSSCATLNGLLADVDNLRLYSLAVQRFCHLTKSRERVAIITWTSVN